MVQTSTIEGTPGVDNWVMAGEPPYITFKGLASQHTFTGSRPPHASAGNRFGHRAGRRGPRVRTPTKTSSFPGTPVEQAWVSLCDLQAPGIQLIYAGACNADGSFMITGVPRDLTPLTAWDVPLDQIIDFRTVDIPAGGGILISARWPSLTGLAGLTGPLLYDSNGNGQHDAGESGIPNIPITASFQRREHLPAGHHGQERELRLLGGLPLLHLDHRRGGQRPVQVHGRHRRGGRGRRVAQSREAANAPDPARRSAVGPIPGDSGPNR